MVNIQDAIDNINSELILFGLEGFSIDLVDEETKEYKLKDQMKILRNSQH